MVTETEAGSLVECACLLPFLVLLIGAAVDLGRAWYVNMEVASAAEAGALYGVQYPNDVAGMKAAAALDAADLSNLQTAVTFGAECADGTQATASVATVNGCVTHSIEFVEINTSVTYQSALIIPGVPSSFAMHGRSHMRSSY